MKLMAGMDLHSNNLMCGIVDMEGKRVFGKKLPCSLDEVLKALQPFRQGLDTIAVESTYNWYWLVDGLQAQGYRTVLANPAGIQQYSGLKHTDDTSDSFFLAELLRLGILAQGYICPARLRPIRDLLRRRGRLVSQRTSLLLSVKSLYTRTTGGSLALKELKAAEVKAVQQWFKHPADQLISGLQMGLIEQLDQSIEQIEKAILHVRDRLPCYEILHTLPGVGIILALTISLETADIGRFAHAGDYASYCRCVNSGRTSNGKGKGQNNAKCGNKYLSWAFVEAANFARRFDERCRKFHDRKTAQTNGILATKALACKLAKAGWHMMKENKPYAPERVFGPSASKPSPERVEQTKTT